MIEEALKRDDFVVVGEVVSPYVAFGLPDPLRSIEATRLAGIGVLDAEICAVTDKGYVNGLTQELMDPVLGWVGANDSPVCSVRSTFRRRMT